MNYFTNSRRLQENPIDAKSAWAGVGIFFAGLLAVGLVLGAAKR